MMRLRRPRFLIFLIALPCNSSNTIRHPTLRIDLDLDLDLDSEARAVRRERKGLHEEAIYL
jgi:hypothetical protein